jgi:mono/diheme cytochrome c family protein
MQSMAQRDDPCATHQQKDARGRIVRNAIFKWLIIANLMVGSNTSGRAQQLDADRTEYEAHCAACHGIDGKGNGPASDTLKTHPADLTMLAKNNNGVFPYKAITEVIDGKKAFKAHGAREMPIWGHQLTPMPKRTSAPLSPDAKTGQDLKAYYDSQIVVRNRILALVDYLYRVQAK